jgi:hypothetical protein
MRNEPMVSAADLRRCALLVIIGALMEIGLTVWEFSTYATFESLFRVHVLELAVFVLGLLAFSVGLLGLALSWAFRSPSIRRISLYMVALPLCGLLSVVAATPLQTFMFKRQVAAVVSSGDRLVAAIRAYEQKHGRHPDALQELVPRYITRLPETSQTVLSIFQYLPGTSDWILSTPVSVCSGYFLTFRSDQKYPTDIQRIGGWGLGLSD